jgi:hypothetical protein
VKFFQGLRDLFGRFRLSGFDDPGVGSGIEADAWGANALVAGDADVSEPRYLSPREYPLVKCIRNGAAPFGFMAGLRTTLHYEIEAHTSLRIAAFESATESRPSSELAPLCSSHRAECQFPGGGQGPRSGRLPMGLPNGKKCEEKELVGE